MVKLPHPNEQPARAERVHLRGPRSHHNWGSRFGRDKEAHRGEPTGLFHLEALAERTVQLMEKHGPKSEGNYLKAMDLLRLQYNLNFIILCEKCGTIHKNHDALLAPER